MAAAEPLAAAHSPDLDKDDRRLFLLAALLLPLRRCTHTVKGKQVPVSSAIIRDSLKWRVKDIEGVAALHDVLPELARLYGVLFKVPCRNVTAL